MAALNDVWPEFLDRLETYPRRSARELYEFAFRVVRVAPPAVFRMLPHDMAIDVLAESISICIQDRFTLLRTYQNTGKPFAFWLRNLITERSRHWHGLYGSEPDSAGWACPDTRRYELAQNVRASLPAEDRLLLEIAADYLRYFEMLRLLRWSPQQQTELEARLVNCQAAFYETLQAEEDVLDELEQPRQAVVLGSIPTDRRRLAQEPHALTEWQEHYIRRLVKSLRPRHETYNRPSEALLQSYIDRTASPEEREHVLAALAASLSFRDDALSAIELFEGELPAELQQEFDAVQVGKAPDFSSYLPKRQSGVLRFAKRMSHWLRYV